MKNILKINEIKLDVDIYPRGDFDASVVSLYKEEMEWGTKFPPIIVGEIQGEDGYFLVDGRHRIEAAKRIKQEHIVVVIKKYADKKEAFIDAVKLNTVHGKPLTWEDRLHSAEILKTFGVSKEQIHVMTRIPLGELFKLKMHSQKATRVLVQHPYKKTKCEHSKLPKIHEIVCEDCKEVVRYVR